MPVFKPTYTAPIPEGAKIIKKAGQRFARFKRKGKSINAPLTDGGRKCRMETESWHVRYKDASGKWQRQKGYTDRRASEQLLAKIENRIARELRGDIDAFEQHRNRPLLDHLEDFRVSLLAKGDSEKHVKMVVFRIKKILEHCGFKRIPEIEASRVQTCLAELRRGGLSMQGSNHHLHAVKQFVRWLLLDRRTNDNRLVHLSGGNAALDRRRERRALTGAETTAVLQAALESPRMFCGLAGHDRYAIYVLALRSGLRAREIAFLQPENFHLEQQPATIRVPATISKHRREDTQPIPEDVAELFRHYLQGKPTGERIWPRPWYKRGAAMLRIDLGAAGVAYVLDGEYADFHCLRHTFCTTLGRYVDSPKLGRELSRHSSAQLFDRYTHLGIHDLSAELAKLPPIVQQDVPDALRATGTDDARPPENGNGTISLTQPCHKSFTPGHAEAQHGTEPRKVAPTGEAPKALETKGFGTVCHSEAQADTPAEETAEKAPFRKAYRSRKMGKVSTHAGTPGDSSGSARAVDGRIRQAGSRAGVWEWGPLSAGRRGGGSQL